MTIRITSWEGGPDLLRVAASSNNRFQRDAAKKRRAPQAERYASEPSTTLLHLRLHMNPRLPLLASLLLAACATDSVKEFRAPDGSSIKTVKCSSDPAKCFATAAQSCPGQSTYRVMSSESHAGGLLADVLPGPVTWYSMTYACGPSDGKMPEFKFAGQQYVPPPPAPVPAAPVVIRQRPSTTNCTTIGNTVTCNTY